MVDNSPRMLAGRYQLGDLIGRGGMAEVHIGRDTRLGRTVAIKVLRSDLARDPTFQARFRREAQAAAGLNHPSIVAVYDTGEDVSYDPNTGEQVHLPFIVMEYVEGHTVRELVRDGAALPIDEAVEITMGVLSALQYAHQAGIVHRDVKPANVMITTTGQVKVMDFGIARALADSAATMTQTQAVIGTAQYLSPEQARGETVDTRSDLYSAGCLLYELLTGRTPFVGDSAVAVAYQHVREEPAPPSAYAPDVPEVLDRITLKALTKDREHRYQSAAEFRADLEASMTGGVVMAPAMGAMTADTQLMQPTAQTQVMGAASPTPSAFAQGQTATQLLQDPDDDDEPMSTKRKVLIGVAIAAGVLIIGLIAWLLLKNDPKPGPTAPAQVAVPQVEPGWKAADAENALKQLNLVPVQKTEPSATFPKDEVIRFDPKSGDKVNVGSEVTYFVSTGPDQVTIPNYAGRDLEEVKADIEKQGLTLGPLTPEPSKLYDKDQVTRTNPKAGKQVAKGTAVTIYYSDGTVLVPDVTGMSRADAESTLTSGGLTLGGTEEQESDQQPGTVISQNPSSKSKVERGTPVTIVLAKAQEKATVPNVYDSTMQEADTAIANQGLDPLYSGKITDPAKCDEPASSGNVCKVDPKPDQEVDKGTKVKYWIFQSTTPATP